ncbi:MAG: hypothetical protein NTU44_03885 [Bacteroidetes bacterium]|nr:hypothetical protein [Bacteroidota bacterium]
MNQILTSCSRVLILAILVSPFFFSCGSGNHTTEKARLDSLSTSLHMLEKEMKDIDKEKVKNTYISSKENLRKLHIIFQNNPLVIEDKQLLDYEALVIKLNKLVSDLENTEKEIQFARQQIEQWNTSLGKKDFSSDDFQTYLHTQSEAINSLQIILQRGIKEWETCQGTLGSLEPVVTKILKNG